MCELFFGLFSFLFITAASGSPDILKELLSLPGVEGQVVCQHTTQPGDQAHRCDHKVRKLDGDVRFAHRDPRHTEGSMQSPTGLQYSVTGGGGVDA